MKKITALLITALILCAAACSGQDEVRVELTQPAATLPPGIEEEERLYADLNGDGENETIVISSVNNDNPEGNENISLGVLSKEAYREAYLREGFYKSAALTRTKGGEVCVLIDWYDHVGISIYTTVCSFDGLAPVLHDSICSRIEDVDGTAVTLGDWADFIGSWNYTREYELTDGFELIPVSDVMISMEDSEPLHTIRELPVEMLEDGGYVEKTLPADSLLYPITGDGESYMDFRLEDGRKGRISYTTGEGYMAAIGGLGESEYFDNVDYWD